MQKIKDEATTGALQLVEIHALREGGYLVCNGTIDRDFGRCPALLAGFSTLADALKWVGRHMKDAEPKMTKAA